jgi:hypothetical protein
MHPAGRLRSRRRHWRFHAEKRAEPIDVESIDGYAIVESNI